MAIKVKMYSKALGISGSNIIRVKYGYLPEITNSLGNMLSGHVVQIIHRNGKTDEVALVRSHETYGEPCGGLYIPMTKVSTSLDGEKQEYSFLGEDRGRTVDIDFSEIAPEARNLVKTAEEAVIQSIKFPSTAQNEDNQQAESIHIGAFEVLSESHPRTPLPAMEKEAAAAKPKKSSFFSRIKEFIH